MRGDREPFDAIKVSPSRLNSYVTCGVAFKMQYVDRIKPVRSGSAALFGNVVHAALEKWAINRQADLLTLMRGAWLGETEGTVLNDFLGAYAALSGRAIRQEHEIRQAWAAKGKESKAPRMTKEWKDSTICKQINQLLGKWHGRLDAESPWLFTDRDPLPGLYDESLVLAKRYEARNKLRPNALYAELAFDVKWHGFLFNGYIDAIEPNLTPDAELLGYDVTDYKTYRAESPGAKDWRQGVIYDVAVAELIARGELALPGYVEGMPVRVVFDYPRLGTRKFYVMGDVDRAKMLAEVQAYHRGVTNDVFLPAAKGSNPDYCDYPDDCCLINRGGCAEPRLIEEAA